jgi:hypothetical protein
MSIIETIIKANKEGKIVIWKSDGSVYSVYK